MKSSARYLPNKLPMHGQPLDARDRKMLGVAVVDRVRSVLALRENSGKTPLNFLPGLATELKIGALYVKDEGFRLRLGSFKALGGAYALMILVQEEASRVLGREITVAELTSEPVLEVAAGMTFACATDGNHGRSVAQGAQLMGAKSVIFVHAGVSQARVEAIANFGAEVIRVEGNYDVSVEEASRVAAAKGWTVLSDTSWPGYEYIPGLVGQGYTAMVREILEELPELPTHVFLQAGVGGFAAAVAGHMYEALGEDRPNITVVDPARAACLFESARVGRPVRVDETQSTVMAMLECYEPSIVAFRVLERVADGFMTLEDESALDAMRTLANPIGNDPAIVAGESGGAGLAGLITALGDSSVAAQIGLGPDSRVLVVNTEGATDPVLYRKIIGRTPEAVAGKLAA